jgi:hypothetical protein
LQSFASYIVSLTFLTGYSGDITYFLSGRTPSNTLFFQYPGFLLVWIIATTTT